MEPDGTGVWRDLIGRFNRDHPGPQIRLMEGPASTNSREDMYSTAFVSEEGGYDIVYCDAIWVPKFAAAGWLVDLTNRISPEDRADYLPSDLQAGSFLGRVYRIPALADAGVLFYRRDLVPIPPETFNELMSAGLQLKSDERWGFLWQGKQYEGLVTAYLEVLWGYGGDWINAETRDVLIDGPEAVAAIDFLKGTIGTVSPLGVTTYTEEDTRNIFQNGRAVFLRNWPYVWTLIQQRDAWIKDRVGIAPMVHAPGHSSAATLGGWGFAISQFCPNPDRAWEFVEFITRAEQLKQVHRRQGRIPARQRLIPSEFQVVLHNARIRPPIPEYAQASDILQRWLSAALTGRAVSSQAVKRIAHETRLLLAN